MKSFNYFLSVSLAVIFVITSVSRVQAQRYSYPELAMKNKQQPLYFDFIVLPGESNSTVTFSSVFAFTYHYLPFKRSSESPNGGKFASTLSLNIEVFNSNKENLGKKNISIENLEPAERAFWSGTAFADTYEESQSDKRFLNGHMGVSLKPGIYSYVLQLNRQNGTETRLSPVRSVVIQPYDKLKTGNILIADKLINGQTTEQLKLSDLGQNIRFGNDFYAFAYIPQYKKDANYTLEVNSVKVRGEDTTNLKNVYEQKLAENNIRTHVFPEFANESDDGNFISLTPSDEGYAYALVKIPASTFPNDRYRLSIKENESGDIVSQVIFQTLWIDMPASLLSLDVSIDMLRFIVDEQTLDRISEGSREERENKFREFWKQRDPTPKTTFNELMAEYYRRIDYAYENFSSRNLPGYESDQGEIYIKFGAPSNVERKFPADGATTEIWHYPNRRFIFKATSGFGDFKLISS